MNTQELKQYWETQIDLTATTEWQAFVSDVQEQLDAQGNIHNISDEKALFIAKGSIAALTWVVNRRAIAEQALEAIAAEEQESSQ